MSHRKPFPRAASGIALALFALPAAPGPASDPPKVGMKEFAQIAEEAYVYAFPMIASYKAMYRFAVDKDSGYYKAPFNEISNGHRVLTPKDTTVVTPNSDTPYSGVWMDLRAEPLVLSVPEVEKGRYYSVQLVDLYTFNYGYVGSRPTGNGAGHYLVAGPGWEGTKPEGIKKIFRCETDLSLALYRTQLFNPADMENVKKVQQGYKVQTLSAYLKQPAPPPAPEVHFPKFTPEAFKSQAFDILNFLLRFCPPPKKEKELRARFALIGIRPGAPFRLNKLSLLQKQALARGMRAGYEKIKQRVAKLGEDINGWRVRGLSGGGRADYEGDWLRRAATAMAGLYANDAAEAMYPVLATDSEGNEADCGKHNYMLTFAAAQLPPVNAFWSVTMYDAKTQLLCENPLGRYLINSAMLPDLKRNSDGSVTLYIQKDSPGKNRESNWLPAPDGPIYLVMRLFWPKAEALEGAWKPPPVKPVPK